MEMNGGAVLEDFEVRDGILHGSPVLFHDRWCFSELNVCVKAELYADDGAVLMHKEKWKGR